MAASIRNRLLNLKARNTQLLSSLPCVSAVVQTSQHISIRWSTNKHYEPKWKPYRRLKIPWVEPGIKKRAQEDNDPNRDPWSAEERKKRNEPPFITYRERDIVLSCTNTIMDPFVPPEGDGKASVLSVKRYSDALEVTKMGATSLRHQRKLKNFEEDFSRETFVDEALDIYMKGIESLCKSIDPEDLDECFTESAIPKVTRGLEKKTLRWEFKGSLEHPRVVHIRVQDMLTKDNMFGQVTVRFLSQQTMALYDRFGRLLFGSEDLIKDVLEYVVFEKHITEEYGQWRIHGKITPEWLTGQTPVYIPTKRIFEETKSV